MKVAAIQMTAGPNWASHRAQVVALVRQAAATGARLIATPENTGGMSKVKSPAPAETDHPAVADFALLARELGVWLLCGSLRVQGEGALAANRSLLFAPTGEIAARYDKIHLFDVDLPTGESHRESETVSPGNRGVLTELDGLRLGLSICYDLRFAALYRALAKAGAQLLAVPAAFTVPTGQAHWEVLLRARAIETGSYVIAPAQVGLHEGGRQTYGHSLIIDPWGRVLAEAGTTEGVITAEIDVAEVARTRAALPALQHDRPFSL